MTGERTAVAGLDWCGLGKNTPLFWPYEFSGRGDGADLDSVRLQPDDSYLKQFCSTGFTFLFDLFVLLLNGITRLLASYTAPRTLFLSFQQRRDEESGVPSRQLEAALCDESLMKSLFESEGHSGSCLEALKSI